MQPKTIFYRNTKRDLNACGLVGRHPELVSGSRCYKTQGAIPNQVWNDKCMKKCGFTLIELLVVVLIIGILATVAVPQYQQAVYKARFTQLVIASKAIVDAQRTYFMANGEYARRADELDIEFPMNVDGTSFRGKDWQCEFTYANGGGGPARTNCNLFYPKIQLQWEHETSHFNCCVYSDFVGETLCQQITQKKAPYSTSSTLRCYSGKR